MFIPHTGPTFTIIVCLVSILLSCKMGANMNCLLHNPYDCLLALVAPLDF